MIINSVQRYDIKGKKLLTTNEKYYAVDLGLRNVTNQAMKLTSISCTRTLIYLELLSRGYDVKVGKNR